MTPDVSDRPASGWHVQAKHILFGVIALAALFVPYNNERLVIDHSDPQWTYFSPLRWLLFPHDLAGAFAIASVRSMN